MKKIWSKHRLFVSIGILGLIILILGIGLLALFGKNSNSFSRHPIQGECLANSLEDLTGCLNSEGFAKSIRIGNDLHCEDCCPHNFEPSIKIKNHFKLTINGDGHYFIRSQNLKGCSALEILDSQWVEINNFFIEEKESIGPCSLNENCQSSLSIRDSSQMSLNHVEVFYSKSNALELNTVKDVKILKGIFSSSGLAGIKAKSVTNLEILNTTLARNRMPALSISDGQHLKLKDNLVIDNSYQSQILNKDGEGLSEGQLALDHVSDVQAINNLLENSACLSCAKPAVPGLELVGNNENIVIQSNDFKNGSGPAIVLDPGSELTGHSSLVDQNHFIGISESTLKIPSKFVKANEFAKGTPSLDRYGVSSYTIFRLQSPDGKETLANSPTEIPGGKIKAAFGLSPGPRAHAEARPIVHCHSSTEEKISHDSLCDQLQSKFHHVLGFNYEPTYAGAKEFYVCFNVSTKTEFATWDAHCEGQTLVKSMGFAVDRL